MPSPVQFCNCPTLFGTSHDRLFRAVFSDASEAAGLLQTALPATVRNSFDWTTLTLVGGTFVDEDLQGSQSDLLYQVEHAATGQARVDVFTV